MTGATFLDSLTQRLTGEEPARLVPKESAGVAVIFRGLGDKEEVLLIRRAEREGDPWSGQVAFPGGMVAVPLKLLVANCQDFLGWIVIAQRGS